MSTLSKLLCVAACTGIVGCSTPFKPPVVVRGSASFEGLLGLSNQQDTRRPVDIVMAHGMCTHTSEWAVDSINGMMDLLSSPQARLPKETPTLSIPGTEIKMIRADIAGGTDAFRVSAIIWSPLTAKLKAQLLYDRTGDPSTDCASDQACRPERVKLNAIIKDRLVSDCFADALIYQGASRFEIRRQMAIALAHATASSTDTALRSTDDSRKATDLANIASASAEGPLAVITDSLGSKVLFDALDELVDKAAGPARSAGIRTRERIGLVFMRANQLPLLALAEPAEGTSDPIKSLSKEVSPVRGAARFQRTVVAFSDPNDLLSYPLLGSAYQGPAWSNVKFADVLVSNARSWLGIIENPLSAHTAYAQNPDVARLILHGSDRGNAKR